MNGANTGKEGEVRGAVRQRPLEGILAGTRRMELHHAKPALERTVGDPEGHMGIRRAGNMKMKGAETVVSLPVSVYMRTRARVRRLECDSEENDGRAERRKYFHVFPLG